MASDTSAPANPLGISTTQTARGLLRIYARLKGELTKNTFGEDVMVQPSDALSYMSHIEALMPLLGVNFDARALKPIRTRPHIGPLDYGDLRAGALAQLRATGDWMTYPEIADGILAQNRVELTVSQRKHFKQKLREAMHMLKKAGAVEQELDLKLGQNQQLQRWRLSRTLFRPRA